MMITEKLEKEHAKLIPRLLNMKETKYAYVKLILRL